MPIEYNGKGYEFDALVKKIKKSKPGIQNPEGYVAAIEKRQKLTARLAALKFPSVNDIFRPPTPEIQKENAEKAFQERKRNLKRPTKTAYYVQKEGNKNYVSATNEEESEKINKIIAEKKKRRKSNDRENRRNRPGRPPTIGGYDPELDIG